MRLLVVVLLLGTPPASGGADPAAASFATSWREGDFWDLEVRAHPRAWMNDLAGARPGKDPAEQPTHYRLRVTVAGTERCDNRDCWQVDFTPLQQGEAAIGRPYRVLVCRETGWPCRVLRGGEIQGLLTERFGSSLFVTGAPEAFPLEFLPLIDPADLKADRAATVLQVRRRQLPDVTVMEATLRVGNRHDLYVKQVWKRGEKFWREYERHYKGHKDLVARVIAPAALADSTAQKGSRPEGGERPRPDPADPHYLRRDLRLRALVTVEGINPPLPDIFAKLHAATGLTFSLDPALADPPPQLGSISLQLRNAPAFTVMEVVAKRALADGRWEQTDTGYRLTGTRNVPPSSPYARLRLRLAPAVVVSLLVIGGVLLWRRQAKKGRLTPAGPAAAPASR